MEDDDRELLVLCGWLMPLFAALEWAPWAAVAFALSRGLGLP